MKELSIAPARYGEFKRLTTSLKEGFNALVKEIDGRRYQTRWDDVKDIVHEILMPNLLKIYQVLRANVDPTFDKVDIALANDSVTAVNDVVRVLK